jgi:hypothetical protein
MKPNAKTVGARRAARRGELTTAGPPEQLLASDPGLSGAGFRCVAEILYGENPGRAGGRGRNFGAHSQTAGIFWKSAARVDRLRFRPPAVTCPRCGRVVARLLAVDGPVPAHDRAVASARTNSPWLRGLAAPRGLLAGIDDDELRLGRGDPAAARNGAVAVRDRDVDAGAQLGAIAL